MDNSDGQDPSDDATSTTYGVSQLEEVLGLVMTVQQDLAARIEKLESGSGDVIVAETGEVVPVDPQWVEWLSDTFYLRPGIPSNWPDRADVVMELRALWIAHQAAYGKKAGPWDQLTWLDHLSRAITRIDASTQPSWQQRYATTVASSEDAYY